MRIAHLVNRIATFPSGGGAEQAAYFIMAQQLANGHSVVVLCAEGSTLEGAEVISLAAPRRNRDFADYVDMTRAQAADAFEYLCGRSSVDVVHDHTGALAPYASRLPMPVVCTLHNGVEQANLFTEGSTAATYVAVSESLMVELQLGGYQVTDFVYPEIDSALLEFPLQPRQQKLVWFGRFKPDKGPDLAVQVALASGYQLVMAGFPPEEEFLPWYRQTVLPFIDHDQIVDLGVIRGNQAKAELLSGAAALLMPNRCYPNTQGPVWLEPCGLTQVEGLAMGVPSLVTSGGALSEVQQGCGVTVHTDSDEATVAAMSQAVPFLELIPSDACRRRALVFGSGIGGRRYVEIYQDAIRA
jgi:glycosyltransferase involved in cell wall biosynthesis